MTIKTLTSIYKQQVVKRPSCELVWPKALGCEVPIKEVWARFSSPNITPRDSKNYFRIVHRSFRTRNLVPHISRNEESPNDEGCACRLCLVERERFSHIGHCPVIHESFKHLSNFALQYGRALPVTPALIFLGATDKRTALTGALSDLHIIYWKFIVIQMVKVDTEGAKFEPEKVWHAAVRRLASRVDSAVTALSRRVDEAMGLGRNPPPLDSYNVSWDPLLYFEYEDQYLLHTTYSTPYLKLISELED